MWPPISTYSLLAPLECSQQTDQVLSRVQAQLNSQPDPGSSIPSNQQPILQRDSSIQQSLFKKRSGIGAPFSSLQLLSNPEAPDSSCPNFARGRLGRKNTAGQSATLITQHDVIRRKNSLGNMSPRGFENPALHSPGFFELKSQVASDWLHDDLVSSHQQQSYVSVQDHSPSVGQVQQQENLDLQAHGEQSALLDRMFKDQQTQHHLDID